MCLLARKDDVIILDHHLEVTKHSFYLIKVKTASQGRCFPSLYLVSMNMLHSIVSIPVSTTQPSLLQLVPALLFSARFPQLSLAESVPIPRVLIQCHLWASQGDSLRMCG